jgi:hypothetical protein
MYSEIQKKTRLDYTELSQADNVHRAANSKISNGVFKSPNGVHLRYTFFQNVVHEWGT